MTENEDFAGKNGRFPDRPLDCSECKRSIAVVYTEVVGETVTRTSMCSQCPELEKRLHGSTLLHKAVPTEHEAGLCCGGCGTTLDVVQKGGNFGCGECYDVFGDLLIKDLRQLQVVPAGKGGEKVVSLHMGRGPGETTKIDPSSRLAALNEALNESLKHEDYEQAARLRDQIKDITGSKDGEEKK